MENDMENRIHDHDRGLDFDLPKLMNRRRALGLFAGAGLTTLLVACGGSDDSSAGASSSSSTTSGSASPTTSTTSASTANTSSEIPEETAGPFPGDGSNGPNVLNNSAVVRSDIRSSFGDYSGTAEGVPLTVTLTVLDLNNSAKPLSGAAVYLWHCNRDGNYSLYSDPNQNYLRGVQVTDANGKVSFTSVYPACYSGRWPHIHFEVYQSLDAASSGGTKLKTSQMALPEDVSKTVYATDGYGQSVTNLSRVSLATDMVFRDGWSLELGTVTGSVANGYTATLNVPV